MLTKDVKWIFCGGMIRSGSTLQYQLVCNLLERAGIGSGGGFYDGSKDLSDYAEPQGVTVVKSHIFDMPIQKAFLKNEAIGFYIYRDIRDVAVSAMRKFSVSFPDLLNKQWLDYAINAGSLWESQNKVRSFRYETSVNDIETFIKTTAEDLEIEIRMEDIQSLAQEHSLKEQRKRADDLKESCRQVDDITQLHFDHIAAGAAGIWRGSLNREQQDTLNILFGDWLQQKDYEVSQVENLLAKSIANWRKGECIRQKENFSNLVKSRTELAISKENMKARIANLLEEKNSILKELNVLKRRYRIFEKLLGR